MLNITTRVVPPFFKNSTEYRYMPSCSYYCKKGHLKLAWPYIRNDSYIIKNTFSIELREQVSQIWVPNGTRQPKHGSS